MSGALVLKTDDLPYFLALSMTSNDGMHFSRQFDSDDRIFLETSSETSFIAYICRRYAEMENMNC